MVERDDKLRELGTFFSERLHLHLVAANSGEAGPCPPEWWDYIESNGHWFTAWDQDGIEMEVIANLGEKALESYKSLEPESRMEVAMNLVVLLEGGIAFTSDCDLVEGQEPPTPAENEVIAVRSGGDLAVLATGKGREAIKTVIGRLLDVGGSETDESKLLPVVEYDVRDVKWLVSEAEELEEVESDEEMELEVPQ